MKQLPLTVNMRTLAQVIKGRFVIIDYNQRCLKGLVEQVLFCQALFGRLCPVLQHRHLVAVIAIITPYNRKVTLLENLGCKYFLLAY